MRRRRRIIKTIRLRELKWMAAVALGIILFLALLSSFGAEAALERSLGRQAKSDSFVLTVIASEMPLAFHKKQEVPWAALENPPAPAAAAADLTGDAQTPETPPAKAPVAASVPEALATPEDIAETGVIPDELQKMITLRNIVELTISPQVETGYDVFGKVFVKNQTKFALDLASLLKSAPKLKFSTSGPAVLIIHTHGTEAYTQSGAYSYEPSDTDRTLDKRYSVIRVGSAIEEILKKRGIETVHITDIFDYPTYSGSYNRALEAISAQMKKTPSIKVVIDIHRDAMIAKDGTKYKTVADIGDEKAAQIMFVCGSSEGGLPHSKWKENFKLVLALQARLSEKYPDLMRPIDLRKERFNQHVTTGSMLVEFGTSGNTLDESLVSARLFGEELAAALKAYSA